MKLWYYFKLGCKTVYDNYFLRGVFVSLALVFAVVFFKGTFAYDNKRDDYNFDMGENVIRKLDVYYNDDMDSYNGVTQTDRVLSCLRNRDSIVNNDGEIGEIINSIRDLFNKSSNYYSFKYEDIYTGLTLSYNEDGVIFGASSVKAPLVIYIYELASKGKIDLDEEMEYTANYYVNGSGIMQNESVGGKYKIRTLCDYAIRYSDNIAYTMLLNRVGNDNVRDFWSNKGSRVIFSTNEVWGNLSARDSNLYMKELYNFYKSDNVYGEEVMNLFVSSIYKGIHSLDDSYLVADKYGWTGSVYNDSAVVLADNPYVLSILSNTGYSDFDTFYKEASDLFGRFHKLWWEMKWEECYPD